MKNETCNDPKWLDPRNGSRPETPIFLLQKLSFGGISAELL